MTTERVTSTRTPAISFSSLVASDHSTVLIDGKGQKGEGKTWFDLSPWLLEREAPRILSVSPSPDVDVIVCDVAPAYPLDSGLKKFIRTFRFQKPDQLEVMDELEARRPVMFEARFQVEGTPRKISDREYLLTHGNVTARFKVNEASGAEISIREGAFGRCFCVAAKRKQLKAQFLVMIRIEEAKP